MPRKGISRAFKLICKHYKGFDRHFTAKALATRKLHASQGVFVNHKLAATPDYKYGKSTGRPLVKHYTASYPSFAAQPVAAHTRGISKLAGYQQAANAQTHLDAPSFAATPVWQGPQGRTGQPSASSVSDTTMTEASPCKSSGRSASLAGDPVYQYATMGRQSSEGQESGRRTSRKQERSALKWYSGLDRRSIGKAPSQSRHSTHLDRPRVAAAFAAYADLHGTQR